MMNSRLNPRTWAFVVVTGGAVCALPFFQGKKSPPAAPQKSDTELLLDSIAAAASPIDKVEVNHSAVPGLNEPAWSMVPAPPVSQVPQWIAETRSPFDEMLAGKTPLPLPESPMIETPNLSPQQPWIITDKVQTGSSNRMNGSQTPELVRSVAGNGQPGRKAEPSPWDDAPTEQQRAGSGSSASPPVSSLASSGRIQWPDVTQRDGLQPEAKLPNHSSSNSALASSKDSAPRMVPLTSGSPNVTSGSSAQPAALPAAAHLRSLVPEPTPLGSPIGSQASSTTIMQPHPASPAFGGSQPAKPPGATLRKHVITQPGFTSQ
ncbi:MAG: hypothetical protein U0892_18975 [Pirellulales bacterium]